MTRGKNITGWHKILLMGKILFATKTFLLVRMDWHNGTRGIRSISIIDICFKTCTETLNNLFDFKQMFKFQGIDRFKGSE